MKLTGKVAEHGVTVNAVVTDTTETEMIQALSEEEFVVIGGLFPGTQRGNVQAVADAAVEFGRESGGIANRRVSERRAGVERR